MPSESYKRRVQGAYAPATAGERFDEWPGRAASSGVKDLSPVDPVYRRCLHYRRDLGLLTVVAGAKGRIVLRVGRTAGAPIGNSMWSVLRTVQWATTSPDLLSAGEIR